MSSAWSRLPFEVLTYVFENNVDFNSQNIQSRKDLYNYQLVCKGWSKAAQSLLYKRIIFQDGSLDEELRRFVQFVFTIKALAPHVGTFVRTIAICDRLDLLQEPLTALDVIFDACPKMEEFHCTGSSKEVAWPYLLTLPDEKLSNIRSITRDDFLEYPNLYPFVAFKLKRSLLKLQHLGIQQFPSWPSIYLFDKLPQFVSLQELSLVKCEFDSYNAICQVIDKCSSTINKLSITNYLPSTNMDAAISDEAKETINPNYSIHQISIRDSWMSSISYFAVKFRNLKKLTMEQVLPFRAPDRWIHGLIDLCASLSEYNLCFNLMLEGSIKDNCIDLTKRSLHKEKLLVIDYNVRDVEEQYVAGNASFSSTWGIILKKDGTHSGIEVRLPGNDGYLEDVDDEFDYHTHWFDDYSPNRITIQNIEKTEWISMMEYEMFSVATTLFEFASSFRDFIRNESTDVKNWTILSKAISSTANTTDALVSFRDMIIVNIDDQVPSHSTEFSPNIKQLTFTNSIFHPQVLPIVSKWLPKLDTLIFDTCYTLMEEPYTLKINLQETKLQRLGIVVAPLTFADSLPPTADIGRHQMKNTDLLKVLAPGSKLTLKIETENKIFLSQREGITTRGNYNGEKDIHQGTKTNFLIWIQCQTLEEFAIVDGTLDTDIELYFEPLASL